MRRSNRQLENVSEGEFESVPERISQHFDGVRELLNEETDDADA
jgi:hypothetical protein